MSKFEFKVLDTMGCLETVILTSDSVCCSSLACRQKCQHMIWLFHHIFGFKKEEPLIYKMKFTTLEWTKLVNAFPESVRVTQIPPFAEKGYSVSSRTTTRTAKCATCKTELKLGDLQVSTEGPYRTILRKWVIRTFYFCPLVKCVTKIPRNSFISPFCPSTMTLTFSPSLTPEQKRSFELSWSKL